MVYCGEPLTQTMFSSGSSLWPFILPVSHTIEIEEEQRYPLVCFKLMAFSRKVKALLTCGCHELTKSSHRRVGDFTCFGLTCLSIRTWITQARSYCIYNLVYLLYC